MDKNQSARDESDDQTGTESAPEGGSGRFGRFLLFMGGAALLLSGCALVALPDLARLSGSMKQYAWITDGFAKHGVNGAPVALTGLVLLGLWIVARSRPKVSQPQPVEDDVTPAIEQLGNDLAQTRGGIQDLRVEFVYLKDAVQSAVSNQQSSDPSAGMDDAQAAIFRLAASMDQLGGRLEQRLKAQDAALQESITHLRREAGETSAALLELRARIEQGIEAASATPAGRAEAGGLDRHHVAFGNGVEEEVEEEIELEPGFRAGADDLHVEVDLEEELLGLGLLDELDELGSPRTAKTSPSIRPSVSQPNVSIDTSQVAAALPSRRMPLQDVERKLAALRELMADPSVRRALEAERRRA